MLSGFSFSIFSVLFLFCAIASLLLFFPIYKIKNNPSANWLKALILVGILCSSVQFILSLGVTEFYYDFLSKIYALALLLLLPAFINFVFSYVGEEKTIKNFYFVLTLTCGFLAALYLWWNTDLFSVYGLSNAIPTPWGMNAPQGSLLLVIVGYFLLYYLYGSFLLLRHYKAQNEPIRRKQALLVAVACCLVFAFDILFEGVFPVFGLKSFPFSGVSIVIMCAIIIYTIYKYRLFYIDYGALAVNLVKVMPLLCFIVDGSGRIIATNPVISQFGFKPDDVVGKPIGNFLEISENLRKFLSSKNSTKRQEESNFLKNGKASLPVEIYANDLMEGESKIATLLVMNDLSGAKANAKSLEQNFEIIQRQNQEMRDNKLAMLNLMEDLSAEKHLVDVKVEERTKELKAESVLLETQNLLFESFITNLPIGALLIEIPSKSVILANHLAITIFNLNPDVAVKKQKYVNLVKLYREDATPYTDSDRPLNRAIKEGRMLSEQVFFHNQDGRVVPLRVHVAPVKNAEGVIVSVIVLIEDISKEYEVDKAKSEFVSLASHQLRTPLSSINWYSEMLESGDAGKLNTEQKDFLNEISTSARRMAELVTTLLNVSRIDMGTFAIDPKPANVCELVTTEIEQLALQLQKKNLKLDFECGLKKLNLKIDAKVFSIILQNLLTNAIKYTPVKGKIKVSVNKDKKLDSCVIAVEDFGYGIPKQQQDKIFGKFFRADNIKNMEIDGNGLGLYMVKSIVENAGCRVWFESVEKQGTVFYFAIPNAGMTKKIGAHKLGELKS